MRTELELFQDFLSSPLVTVNEYSQGLLAKGDDIKESFEFVFNNGDLCISGKADISANNKLSYWADYEIGVLAAFGIEKTLKNHLIFSAFDNNEYRPVIKNNNVIALDVLIPFEGATKVFYFRNEGNLPFIDIQGSELIDRLPMQA